MTSPRFRAWRFVHPDFDLSGLEQQREPGLRLTARGRIAMVDGDESVRQGILLLLSTVPGERVMLPDYGCDLHRLVFSPNDDTTAGLAIHYVQQAIERYEPRVEIVRLDATRYVEQEAALEIALEYRVRATQNVGQLAFSISLAGES
jgi:uncharacterized protein